ncbi:MAG TPA: N-acetyltransferase [Rhizomicrobium sp.]|jgi:predicted N-acetyltransferase YhbS
MAQDTNEASWSIRAEIAADVPAIDALVERCFGPGRYAKSAYRLREGVNAVADLSFVAIEDGILRGSVRFWPVAIGPSHVLLLGPLAVESAQRGRGIGVKLMETGIATAQAGGWPSIVLVGDEPYYARVGFAKLPPSRVKFPGPVDQSRVLGLSLQPNALLNLSGEVRRPHLDDPICASGAATRTP